MRAVESAARTALRIAATVRRARRVLSWTAGCRLARARRGARDQTGAGAFFCYGGFHRALQASALECREAVIEWAAFAYQAVSEAARVRKYGALRRATATLDARAGSRKPPQTPLATLSSQSTTQKDA